MEQWLDVADFPKYEVSDQGRIRNKKSGRQVQLHDNGSGGMMVRLYLNGQPYSRLVRRVVANAFLPIGDEHLDASPVHIDGDYRNCSASNLDWRPRWQARVRTMQKRRSRPMRNENFEDLDSGEIFANSLEAANAIDGIETWLIHATLVGYSYKGRRFRMVW